MSLTPTVIWLLIGGGLCLAELILPTAFIAFVMGLSALIVAGMAGILPVNGQIALWVGLSLLLVMLSRRMVNRKAGLKLDANYAETLTAIAPGQAGRVLYEGNSWAARCDDPDLTIAPQQRVYVVARQGTTLIVEPASELHP
jgi:membrane protein implicated in regulation of membrane protease activity